MEHERILGRPEHADSVRDCQQFQVCQKPKIAIPYETVGNFTGVWGDLGGPELRFCARRSTIPERQGPGPGMAILYETLGTARGASRVGTRNRGYVRDSRRFQRIRGLSTSGARICDQRIMILCETLDSSRIVRGQGQEWRFCTRRAAI